MKMVGTILVGQLGAPVGVRGEIRLRSFTADPMAIADYPSLAFADGAPVALVALREQGKGLVARIKGVGDRDAAEKLVNRELFIDRADMGEPEDEDEFYLADLVGLAVVTGDGAPFGTVRAVHDFGAGDIVEVAQAGGATQMFAFTRAIFPEIDIAAGRMTIAPPPETSERDDGGRDDGGRDDGERGAGGEGE